MQPPIGRPLTGGSNLTPRPIGRASARSAAGGAGAVVVAVGASDVLRLLDPHPATAPISSNPAAARRIVTAGTQDSGDAFADAAELTIERVGRPGPTGAPVRQVGQAEDEQQQRSAGAQVDDGHYSSQERR